MLDFSRSMCRSITPHKTKNTIAKCFKIESVFPKMKIPTRIWFPTLPIMQISTNEYRSFLQMKIGFVLMTAFYTPHALHTVTLILTTALGFCIITYILHIEWTEVQRSNWPRLNSLSVVTELVGGQGRILTSLSWEARASFPHPASALPPGSPQALELLTSASKLCLSQWKEKSHSKVLPMKVSLHRIDDHAPSSIHSMNTWFESMAGTVLSNGDQVRHEPGEGPTFMELVF